MAFGASLLFDVARNDPVASVSPGSVNSNSPSFSSEADFTFLMTSIKLRNGCLFTFSSFTEGAGADGGLTVNFGLTAFRCRNGRYDPYLLPLEGVRGKGLDIGFLAALNVEVDATATANILAAIQIVAPRPYKPDLVDSCSSSLFLFFPESAAVGLTVGVWSGVVVMVFATKVLDASGVTANTLEEGFSTTSFAFFFTGLGVEKTGPSSAFN
mmetsp:Transcript_783/g.1232  ORF Transcript_783/g.1232 Transcript_783/m.1232 type:complete len:212 (-) Transcript_783:480-1115(-)